MIAVLRGDARALPLPDGSVDLIVTSPPYTTRRPVRGLRKGHPMTDDHKHTHSVLPPRSIWSPGPCKICGKSWERLQAEKDLADAQAALAAVTAAEGDRP